MEKSFGLLFYLKKSRGYQKGELPVYLRITVNGVSTEISVKRKCASDVWIPSVGRKQGKTEEVKAFNQYLDVLQHKVYEAKRMLLEENQPVTAETIKCVLQGRSLHQRKMLMEIFRQHNEQVRVLVGKEYAAGTMTIFNTTYKHTLAFLKSKYNVEDLEITRLDFEFITEFEFWMKSRCHCDHNTTMKYLGYFRKIINRCIRSGWLSRDPFMGFSMAKREVERSALTQSELQCLQSKKILIQRLALVRDIFLFSCYTGLSYADVQKLSGSDISIGVDSEKWIIKKRTKTHISSRIPLLPIALTILEQYKDNPNCLLKGKLLPVLSNQKMNAYLKEIADICGITKKLTFHIARHTFATTITLSNGVPMETVSKMLGHSNLRTTQHYAKILDRKISQDMKHLHQKYTVN